MVVARLAVSSTAFALLVGASCAGTPDDPQTGPPPEAPAALEAPAAAAPSTPAEEPAAEPVARPAGDGSMVLVESRPITNGRAHVAGESLFLLSEPFGPPPGFTMAELITWQDVLGELHVTGVEPARQAQLERLLGEFSGVDLTPAYLNLLHDRDMADPTDIAIVRSLSLDWYDRQYKYKLVAVDGNVENTGPVIVRGRLASLDGWVRLWDRTLETEGGVARYRKRVADLAAEHARLLGRGSR